jgi:hypothetical protein
MEARLGLSVTRSRQLRTCDGYYRQRSRQSSQRTRSVRWPRWLISKRLGKAVCPEPVVMKTAFVGNFTHEIQPAKVPPLFRHHSEDSPQVHRGRVRHPLQSRAILCWCLAVALLGYLAQSVSAAADSGVHTISGIVDEVLASETPPIIMIKSRPGMKGEAVIGAVVKKGASIVRGKQRIALSHIRAGERVTLTYVKQRDGLTVRSIVVHSK